MCIINKEKKVFPYIRDEIAIRNEQALLSLMEQLELRGIETILLRTPHMDGYWDALDADSREKFQRLVERFDSAGNVPIWDFDKPSTIGLSVTEFRDGDHLNSAGAERFSRALDSRLSKLFNE